MMFYVAEIRSYSKANDGSIKNGGLEECKF